MGWDGMEWDGMEWDGSPAVTSPITPYITSYHRLQAQQ
jgi:hypothetical protein